VLPAAELQFESFLPLVGLAFVLEVEVDDDLGDALSWKYRLTITNPSNFDEYTEESVEEDQCDLSCCWGCG
jgi:hypothetical protein